MSQLQSVSLPSPEAWFAIIPVKQLVGEYRGSPLAVRSSHTEIRLVLTLRSPIGVTGKNIGRNKSQRATSAACLRGHRSSWPICYPKNNSSQHVLCLEG